MSLNTLKIYDSAVWIRSSTRYYIYYIPIRRYANMYRGTWKIIRFINLAPFSLRIESHQRVFD